jgi:hypothetical protein
MAVAVPWAYVHDHRCRIDRQDGIPGCLAILAIRSVLDSLPTMVGAPAAAKEPLAGANRIHREGVRLMTNPAPNRERPWRVLILDKSDPADPKWILATVVRPDDVWPVKAGANAVDDVTAAWDAFNNGLPKPTFIAMPAVQCWRIDDRTTTRDVSGT